MNRITKVILSFIIACSSVVLMLGCKSNKFIDNNNEISQSNQSLNESQNSPDVWNGEVADRLSCGDGTENNPYQVCTCAELAYLAKSVNEGNTYSGKYISLTKDLDLNNIDWTPIGNGEHSFQGIFDGRGYSISHLLITEHLEYRKPYHNISPDYISVNYYSGLFGSCKDVTFRDISVQSAKISVPDVQSFNEIYAGILVGYIEPDTSCIIENVRISDASITLQPSSQPIANGSSTANLGGIAGSIFTKGTVQCRMERLEAVVDISCENAWNSLNYLGGIVGGAGGVYLSLECTDFHSDLTAELSEVILDETPAGAFGWLGGSQVTLSNAFCVTKLNKTYGYFTVENAIVGENSLWGSTVRCKNLYGCVMPKDDTSLLESPAYQPIDDAATAESFLSLYRISVLEERGGSLTEENCVACISLPEDHGLSSEIWDLTDLGNPKLK